MQEPLDPYDFFEELNNAKYPCHVRLWRRLRRTFGWSNLRGKAKQPVYLYQRARYGVSERDTWSLDHHVAGVLARGCRRIAAPSLANGAPNELYEQYGEDAFDVWRMILLGLAECFETGWGWDPDSSSYEQQRAQELALRLLPLYFTALWD